MTEREAHPSRTRGVVAQALVVALAAGLVVFAILADRGWLYRHFLPEFFQPRDEQLRWLLFVRVVAAVLGLLLLWPIRPWLGRWAASRSGHGLALDVLPTLLAVVLALGVSEVLLHHLPWFSTHQVTRQREPLRRTDPVTGWAYAENRVGRGVLGGRMVEYAFDRAGHRVRAAGQEVDYAAPSVLFVGESIITGNGVTYEESIPAQVGARLGLQPANLSVGGFATDQMYLRFKPEWPRYAQPKAVVILFMPSLFHRNLEHDRPHLEPGLIWRPPSDDPRLFQIARRLAPYRSDQDLADGMTMTRQALTAMVAIARAKGAVPLILTPDLQPETAEEELIRARVLKGLPSLQVAVDPAFHIRGNRHPDARGARVIADAVAARLAAEGMAGPGLQAPRSVTLATFRR